MISTRRAARHYLLAPSEPTPNGPLHLGHIAGPFLRTDVLARFLRMRGDVPAVMTGTDAYEPWVAMKARMSGTDPMTVVSHYHREIRTDLEALRIGIDTFVNPVEEPWHTGFREEIDSCLRRLRERGAVVTRTERMPYDPGGGRFVIGPLLLGGCPDCGAEAAGYFCEECGAHFRPEEITDPRARFAGDEEHWEWRDVDSLFVRAVTPADLETEFDRLDLAERYRDTVRALVRRCGGGFRLSVPERWGMPLPGQPGHGPVPASLFSYAGCFMFARLLGELHRRRIGADVNSFSPVSDVVTVTSIGSDNIVPTVLCINAVAPVHGDTRPYDRCLVNEFYRLEGEKFSTSRKHAIRASTVARVPGLPADATRHYLAMNNPETRQTDFVVREFLAHVNGRLAGELESRVEAAWKSRPEVPGPLPGRVLTALNNRLERMERALDGPTVHLAETCAVFDSWIDAFADGGGTPDWHYWWLKGVALLGYPLTPDYCTDLWHRLGAHGEPRTADFADTTPPSPDAYARWFHFVSEADFAPCLPASLR
ncbi:class I tRNA ligase family protein [Streptomyces sp. HK10]|uniref:class I tRNA ligase family protein n=1 Tax=Streptomyces sp. HK10 TaxID=3373255 RepID=UPI00374A3F47